MKSLRQLSPTKGAILLVIATALWGSSFVVIKQIIPDIPAAPICVARFVIAAIALSPFLRFDRKLWRYGLEIGIWLFAGFATQTIGLHYTTVNRSAFITAMNVIFVPILAALVGHRVRPLVWFAALTALTGCALLCGDSAGPNIGDLWSLGTAIVFGLYIFRLESIAPKFPALPLALAQIFPVAIFSAAWLAASPAHITNFHWPSLIYLGVAATAMTTWLQAFAQKVVPAPQAAVIFTLEPVFAAILGYLMLHESLAPRGMVGAGLIILAAIASQIPSFVESRQTKTEPV